ncbi:MAG: DUF563 domain-containing protein [Bacteroidales bacterium]|nr:DUF563 domain-containing protein [Bacteroidales bacterium]
MPSTVYFSRTKLQNGRDFGEKYIEESFANAGFTVIYPETLTLEQQFLILKNCKVFASTEGSISHNVMFCQDGVQSIIVRKTRSLNGYQFSSLSIRNSDSVWIDAHLSLFKIFDGSYGPFFLYVNDNLSRYFDSIGMKVSAKFPLGMFIRYILRSVWLSLRYRQRIRLIGDSDYYCTRLRQEVGFRKR